ncbi:MAG: metallophosphoesterase [Candidatus Aenigmatarchaeota archaeon]
MKIAVFSDMHFGYAYNSETEDDCFENASEAFELVKDCDLILIPGDIFDSRVPKTGVWANAIRMMVKPLLRNSTGMELVDTDKNIKEISKRSINHQPVVALHGTHERRGKGEINAVEALEDAGILIHLHLNYVVFEKDGKKVAVHGMSGVPERYAYDVLSKWNPQPIPNCINILMIHQSIDPYIYSPLEPPTLNLANLPKGFDVIIDGHLHGHSQQKIGNNILLFSGSVLMTQMEKKEAEIPKGVHKIIIENGIRTEFVPLTNSRKFYYEEVEASTDLKETIEARIKTILLKQNSKKPIIKIKISGKDEDVFDQDLKELMKKYENETLVVFSKDTESAEIERKIDFLRNIREHRFSAEDMGQQILRKNLDQLGFGKSFDDELIFGLLSEGDVDKSFQIVLGEQKTLK